MPALLCPQIFSQAPMGHLDIKEKRHHDVSMRTTLTLDADVAQFLREQSRLLDKPFKQVVNDAIRRGMASGKGKPRGRKFKISPNHSGLVAGIDPQRLNQLHDELEVEDFLSESR